MKRLRHLLPKNWVTNQNKMGLALTSYRLAAPLLRPKAALGETRQPRPKRPPGPLIWLHTPKSGDHSVIDSLVAGLTDQLPDLWFLITSNDGLVTDLPDHCFTEVIPADTTPAILSFLDHWKPDLLAWVGGSLRPALIADSAARGFPLFLLEAEHTLKAARKWLVLLGLTGATLRTFTKIFAADERAVADLCKAGANRSQIEVVGVLEREITVLSCNEAERGTLARILTARPVWLAAGIDPLEYEPIVAAHMFAMRRSHRYLLILVPSDPAQGGIIAKMLAQKGISYAQRSAGEEPEAETQIYIADTDGELGLWYRLAPVAFIGNTFPKTGSGGPNPLDAATLGSAVIHGPDTEQHGEHFHRLARAGASMNISDADDLAAAVATLLAPDKAAEMAHAAWNICSAGAETTDHVINSLVAALAKNGASK